MKRNDINGFTINIFSFNIEIVIAKYIPCYIAIYKGIKLIKRFERK